MAIRYSIIIPTFNRAQQLLLTLVSFETQTYPKHQFEVIVADDGSTDGTKAMVKGFQASCPLSMYPIRNNAVDLPLETWGCAMRKGYTSSSVMLTFWFYLCNGIGPISIPSQVATHVEKEKSTLIGCFFNR